MTRRTKRAFLGIAALAAASVPGEVAAQTDPVEPGPWKLEAMLGLNLAQSSFTSNWAGGDQGNINWVLRLDANAKRQFSEKFNWANVLLIEYGQTSRQEESPSNPDENVWSKPEKTTDQILAESTARYTGHWFADPYAALRLDSFILDQNHPSKDLFFNPLQLKESAGLARALQRTEGKDLLARLGFGLRQTFSRSFPDPALEETTSHTTNDGGVEFQLDADYLWGGEKLRYVGKLLVFFPLFFSDSDAVDAFDEQALAFDPTRESVKDFWKDPDVDWQNTLSLKIKDWLSANLYAQLVYNKYDRSILIEPTDPIQDQIVAVDSGIRKGGQFKQTLALGLSYRFL